MSSGSTPALAYSFYINTAPNPPYLELKTSVENYTLTSLLDTTNSITYTFGQVTQRAASIDQFTNMYIFGKAGEYARTELTWKDENVFYSIFLCLIIFLHNQFLLHFVNFLTIILTTLKFALLICLY